MILSQSLGLGKYFGSISKNPTGQLGIIEVNYYLILNILKFWNCFEIENDRQNPPASKKASNLLAPNR